MTNLSELYKRTFTVRGEDGAYTKFFQVEGPAAISERKWCDIRINTEHSGNYVGTLSRAQAEALTDEIRSYFGIDRYDEACPRTPPRKAPKGPQVYRGNGKHSMELVYGDLHRLRVPGGWLYFDTYVDKDEGKFGSRELCGATTFVPVPEVVGYKI